MQAKKLNIESAFLSTAAANLLNCAIGSLAGPVGYTQTQPFLLLTHIRLLNLDTASRIASLYKGTSGGSSPGTQFGFANAAIPPGTWVDWYGEARFDSADFLTGICDGANKVVINVDAEIGLS
jgi:hypothetical protein